MRTSNVYAHPARKRAQYLYDVVLAGDLNCLLAVVQRSEDGVTSPGDEQRHTSPYKTDSVVTHNGTESASVFSFFVLFLH